MDSACKVWNEICGTQGNCFIYEKTDMGIKLCVWWVIVKLMSLTFNLAARYFYNPPPNADDREPGHQDSDNSEHSMSNEEKRALTDTADDDVCKESVI